MKFTRAIVKKPCENMVNGLTTAKLGKPDYALACKQHSKYVEALRYCGLEVTVLPADNNFPDSTFVEDPALLTSECAIITMPGDPSRRGEIDSIRDAVSNFYTKIEQVFLPGTIDAGDIMMVGKHFYIGLSERTNHNGARQVIDILNKYGMTGTTIEVGNMLHLKSGVNYLENHVIAATREFWFHPEFQKFDIMKVDLDEAYATNCLWLNGKVLVADGFPKVKEMVKKCGYEIVTLSVSEFQKLDGGLSCLSLRF
jgi:dimethylargininase